MQNTLVALPRLRLLSDPHWNRDLFRVVTEAPHAKGTAMNRNVTISLGALIVIIIIVALVF
ncbi:MAG TPA: hypothetical protein VF650_14380 [Allosphingosinicella sp.]|jgi:hypothetical protein